MKRANGSGTVEPLADGRARVRVVVDGKRVQLGPIHPSEAAAKRVLTAWLAERGEGEIVAASEVTLGSYGEEWLDRRELHGSARREKVRSISSERSVWTRQVMTSELASMPLGNIRPRDVERFAMELRGRKAQHAITRGRGASKVVTLTETSRPLSRAQQREALRLVRSVLDLAVREEMIERNPAEGIEVARGSARPRDLSEDWLRWPEAVQLLACEKIDARDRRAYACAIGLALRLSDLKTIELSRIELDVEVPGPGISVLVSKTQRWHRVPVMPWLAEIIREQIASLPAGARHLFPNPDGGSYARDYDFGWGEDRERRELDGETVLEREPGALEVAGIARRVRFHDLRGTCATHLALGTWGRQWSLHEIQAMLAHSDQRVTERYVRRAVDTLAAAAAATPGCPALPLRVVGATGESPAFPRTPGAGLEPATNRLTAPGPSESSREVTPPPGQPRGNRAAELAEQVIVMAAEGDPLTMRRALELAALVVAEARAEAPRRRPRDRLSSS